MVKSSNSYLENSGTTASCRICILSMILSFLYLSFIIPFAAKPCAHNINQNHFKWFDVAQAILQLFQIDDVKLLRKITLLFASGYTRCCHTSLLFVDFSKCTQVLSHSQFAHIRSTPYSSIFQAHSSNHAFVSDIKMIKMIKVARLFCGLFILWLIYFVAYLFCGLVFTYTLILPTMPLLG